LRGSIWHCGATKDKGHYIFVRWNDSRPKRGVTFTVFDDAIAKEYDSMGAVRRDYEHGQDYVLLYERKIERF
jgi:hypothetical protein